MAYSQDKGDPGRSAARSGFVTQSGLPQVGLILIFLVGLLILAFLARPAGLNVDTVKEGLPRLMSSARGMITMPDWASFDRIAAALLETTEMAFLGTVISVPISFVLSLLIARNTSFHPGIGFVFRTMASVFRAVPFFVWAMVLISMIGLGVAPGIFALVITSCMFGAKMSADSLENVEIGPIEGVQAAGAGWLETRRYGILPQAMSKIGSHAMYQFEINIRMATAVGVVGAGGIGFLFAQALRMVDYGRTLLILISIMTLVAIVELLGRKVRELLG